MRTDFFLPAEIKIIRSHLDYIQSAIADVDSAIDAMVAKHENLIAL